MSYPDICWEKYGVLIGETINWFRRRGLRYRYKPWKHVFLEKHTRGILLDLGCGLAATTQYFLSRGKISRAVLVDLSCETLEQVKSRVHRVIRVCGDILDPFFSEESFDTIYLLAVLHHIPGRECRLRMLEKSRDILRIEGSLIVTVWYPSREAFFNRYRGRIRVVPGLGVRDVLICDSYGCRYYHLYEEEELLRDIVDSGLRIIDYGVFYQDQGGRVLTRNIYVVAAK